MRFPGLLLLALAMSSGGLGCASAPTSSPSQGESTSQPVTSPPATAAPQEPETGTTPPPATASEAAAPKEIKSDSKVIVVDPGDGGEGEVTLVEAARAERERKAHARPPVAVITGKTLPRYATGQVTVAKPKQKENAPGEGEDGSDPQSEKYWREGVLEIRTRWHRAAEEIKEFERSAADWRRRFYAEDDPYFRDGQIKPEWDRVLDRLREARVASEEAQQDLAKFLEEGRRSGALPGWLREGIELEPPVEKKEPAAPEPIEPPIIDEDGI